MPLQPVFAKFSPAMKFLLLISLFLVFLGLASVLQVVILAAYANIQSPADLILLQDYTQPGIISGMKMAQAVSAIISFIVPAWLFALLSSEKKIGFLKLDHAFNYRAGIKVILLVFAMMPVINWLGELNSKMSLPEFMSGVETWMRNSEEELKKLTEAFLQMNTVFDLLVNLFVVAFLAALGEELFFRGAMQNTLIEWIGNKHVAIFISAALFSAMHIQFLGFVPRMMLGVVLGYLYVWTNSLWMPILFHFANNGAAVIFTYLISKGNISKDAETIGTGDSPMYYPIVSIVASATLLYFIYQNSREKKNLTEA